MVLVRTASPRPTIYVLSRNMKNIRVFVSENFQFLEVKFSIYLNRGVFVMHLHKYSKQEPTTPLRSTSRREEGDYSNMEYSG